MKLIDRILKLCLFSVAWLGCASILYASPQTPQSTPKRDPNVVEHWSPAIKNLEIRMDIDDTQSFVKNQEFEIELKLRSPKKQDENHPKLLAGRFVVVMVPLNLHTNLVPVTRAFSFDGGGGFEYQGDIGNKYKIKAPAMPGRFQIFACVNSTNDDIKHFTAKTRMPIKHWHWWTGVLASPSQLIVVNKPTPEHANREVDKTNETHQ